MKRKSFDCVEMKREGARRIYEQIRGMTPEEELAYWRERHEEFRKEWLAARKGRTGGRRKTAAV